ncbi:hypothetical protein [Rhodobacter sp. CZR27]|uniref:hypothetical protein n=1 Tax=Rhodobacter sp. CZR27 TaxID=2033869 RepID=UPI000BBE8A09|nr:hypothetical protein [Rhodobacter sp. CZR27]
MRTALSRLLGLAALAGAAVCAPHAHAGPWAREDGAVFLTLSQQGDAAGESWTGLWAEYGLTPRITLGIDAGVSGRGDGKFILWGQKAWVRGEHRFAASAGIGASFIGEEVMPLAQLGGGWGRGLSTRFGAGWVAAEARAIVTARNVTFTQQLNSQALATYVYMLPETSAKAELTLGLRPRDRLMLISQVQLEQGRDTGLDMRLANSVVYSLRDPAKLEVGLITPISGEAEPAVKLGLWLEF